MLWSNIEHMCFLIAIFCKKSMLKCEPYEPTKNFMGLIMSFCIGLLNCLWIAHTNSHTCFKVNRIERDVMKVQGENFVVSDHIKDSALEQG